MLALSRRTKTTQSSEICSLYELIIFILLILLHFQANFTAVRKVIHYSSPCTPYALLVTVISRLNLWQKFIFHSYFYT